MKAITLWQPWASLVAVGAKWIETRSWATSYRGPLAIHAAQAMPSEGRSFLLSRECWSALWPERRSLDAPPLPRGRVVAVCNLVDVVPITFNGEDSHVRRVELVGDKLWLSEPDVDENGEEATFEVSDQLPFGDFRSGRYAWLLTDITPLTLPVRARGRQQLWDWEPPT